ncbi:MAG: diguanylate phosphodiesterase [Proteobacteria bacterium]|nr:MAG: diguanylate phosphodiesterase [Pseudomonadota bacterium]
MSEKRDGLFARAEEVLSLFRRGAEFTQELLKENERLRGRLAELQTQQLAASDEHQWEKLRRELLGRIHDLERERESAVERLRMVEGENRQFAERYLEIEEENNNLASLYVASYQLHSTLDLAEVVKIVVEIVINLIGAEVFAIYILDERTQVLSPVASEGREISEFAPCELGYGMVGAAVASGETQCGDAAAAEDLARPIVCVPLRVQERPIGAIAIHKLLQQKDGFTPLDHELFTLLAGHAATAVFAARLHSQSERKLNTIQGFIDLLTK